MAKTSKYWGVCYSPKASGTKLELAASADRPWLCQVTTCNGRVKKHCSTEREAAIHADRINLEYKLGKPLNILKAKVQ